MESSKGETSNLGITPSRPHVKIENKLIKRAPSMFKAQSDMT